MASSWVDVPRVGSALTVRNDGLQDPKLASRRADVSRPGHRPRSRFLLRTGISVAAIVVVLGGSAVWAGLKGTSIKSNLEAASDLLPQLKQEIASSDAVSAADTVAKLREYTSKARVESADPVWTLASGLPFVGPNVAAVSEVARTADDVAVLGLTPLVNVYETLKWDSLMPSNEGSNLESIQAAAPTVASSSYAVQVSSERLHGIDTSQLLPQVTAPLSQLNSELEQAVGALRSAADAAKIAPAMLGAQGQRSFLLVIQNNAESRASGGIPGALAILNLDHGKLTLGTQGSAADIGSMNPSLPVDPQQQQIFSTRLGKYLQDVNLTPDFPTAAATAQAMWEKKSGQRVDGVISIDPIVLSYVLQATGPVALSGPEMLAAEAAGLPNELSGSNVVPTLLSDVYAKIKQPKLQDAYFAGAAKEIFLALSSGKSEAKGLVAGISKGAAEGRVLVWSADSSEQSIISKYPISGSVSGPSVSPAQFGVYFNDGTGAKMDYYVKRTVKLIKECQANGYQQTTVRVTSTNTAPSDAATALPAYVTGAGVFGIPPGTVQTNVVAYGPAQANVESATIDGQKTSFAPYLHANRPVGVVAQQLAPGESKIVEFTFGKIVQHTEPNIVVTPSVQPVKDVILPTEKATCDEGQ